MAFTDITPIGDITGSLWLSSNVVSEVIQSINEHIEAVDTGIGVIPTDVAIGDDAQAASFWTTLQTKCDSLITNYVNHIDYAGGFEGEADIPLFENAYDFFQATDGIGDPVPQWLRVVDGSTYDPAINDWTDVDDPMYLTGGIPDDGAAQATDIMGPWLLWNLQRCLSNLVWTRKIISAIDQGDGSYWRAGSAANAVCATSRAGAITSFNATPWSNSASNFYYHTRAEIVDSPPGTYSCVNERFSMSNSGAEITSICQDDTHVADCYLLIEKGGRGIQANAYEDMDSIGVNEAEYHKIQTFALSNAASHNTIQFGLTNNAPFNVSGLSCPTYANNSASSIYAGWVLKWSFDGTYTF